MRVQLLLLVVVCSWVMLAVPADAQQGSLVMIGSRLIREGDFYGAKTTQLIWEQRADAGGRIRIYLRNTSAHPIEVKNVAVNGVAFENFPKVPIARYVPDTQWWILWPNPIPPGEVASFGIRFADLAPLGDKPVKVDLTTQDGQTLSYTVPMEASTLWMPFIGFSDDLSRAIIYAANGGKGAITLADDGGVLVNGQPVKAVLPKTTLMPGDVAPITITLPFTAKPGQELVFQMSARSGQHTIGSLRAFPARFGVTLWGYGHEADNDDIKRHNIDLDIPGFRNFQDEPIGGRVPTMSVRDRIVDAWKKKADTPIMVQYTGYVENMIYADMADIHMTHHGNLEQDLSLFLTWPKPIWYLPQTAWGRKEGIGRDEWWYPLEVQLHEALEGVAHGAKNIQWFTYFNLWEQGYARGGGHDAERGFQDFYMPGAVANPVEWDRVGRVSGLLQVLKSYIAVSCPLKCKINTAGIEVNTLVSGTDRALVILVDHRSPHDVYKQARPVFTQQVLYNQTVRVDLPEFITTKSLFLVDQFAGVEELPIRCVGGTQYEFVLPQLHSAAVLLVGDPADGERLRQAWQQVVPTFTPADDARVTALSEAQRQPRSAWHVPECAFRQRIVVTNTTGQAVQQCAVPVKLPGDRFIDERSLRAVEVVNGKATPIPFSLPWVKEYESFLDDEGLSHPTTELSSVSHQQGILTLSGQHAKNLHYFYLSFPKAHPWDGEAWIPAQWSTLVIEADLSEFPYPAYIAVLTDFDWDGDGRRDEGGSIRLNEVRVHEQLDDGWQRFYVNIEEIFSKRFPDKSFTGSWGVRLQTVLLPGKEGKQVQWRVRRIALTGNSRLGVQTATPIPAGQRRSIELYYDLQVNGPSAPAVTVLRDPQPDAPVLEAVLHDVEQAGVSINVKGKQLTITTDALARAVMVRQIAADGSVRLQRALSPKSPRQFTTTLPDVPKPDDIFVCAPVQPCGEGISYCFTAKGQAIVAGVPSASMTPGKWSLPLGTMPHAIDMTADARMIAVGVQNAARLLDAQGRLLWEQNYPGRVFYVRFSPDASRLYVTANLGTVKGVGYEDSHVLCYDLEGKELWRYKFGRTIFGMETFSDQGVGICEWSGKLTRLSPDGNKLWEFPAGFYALRLAPLADGGAIVQSHVQTFRVSPEGKRLAIGASGWPQADCAATSDGSLWVAANNLVHILDGENKVIAKPYVGRNVRTVDVSPDGKYVAAGTCDGVFHLLSASGEKLWESIDKSSYVTDVRFLPQGGGVVVARELFNYAPRTMWRYRDVVEVFDLTGKLRWRHDGCWRVQPSMNEIVLSGDGRYLLLATGADVRLIDATAKPISNATQFTEHQPKRTDTHAPEMANSPERLVELFDRAIGDKSLAQMGLLHHDLYKGVGGSKAGALAMYEQFFRYGEFLGIRYHDLAIKPVEGKPNQVTLQMVLDFPAWGQVNMLLEKVKDGWVIRERTQ